MRRVVVLGSGAIGGTIGAMLAESGTDVVLVARGPHLDAMRRDGLSVRLPDRGFVARLPLAASVDEVDWRPGDVAMLAVKLNDAAALLDRLEAAAGPEIPIICTTNGIDGEREAAARFSIVLTTMVWMPATHLVPGEVRLHSSACPGVLDTGCVHGDGAALAEAFCTALRVAGFDAVPRADIDRWCAAKWITNLGGAAQAMVEDDWHRVAKAAQIEGAAVLDAVGVERVPADEFAARVAAVDCVPVDGEPRGGGSAWQSLQRGLPMETPWIEGALAALAADHGVPAEVNTLLAEAARAPRRLRAEEVLPAKS